MQKLRIGIDVGGTFTDAVAVDGDSFEIVARAKIPTTHDDEEGVAAGIINILQLVLEKAGAKPEQVSFIAHGTTQATNALLEGDTAKVGILAIGDGLIASRVKEDTALGNIELAPGKYLKTVQEFVKAADVSLVEDEIETAVDRLSADGAEVIAATEAFSVDDAANEQKIMDISRRKGIFATGGHEVSQLYGLNVRTRTAVVNASLIPKMIETANLTEKCVKRSGIGAPLMIMRCDGGVMTVDEVRRRPILTMLSGLAAGVAGALMYEHVSDGIFLEAGGTSTDISAIRNGRVMVRYGEIGGHKTYLNSLDVRTLGVAGGSLIRVEKGKITDVGPRSAHIAGLKYEVFSDPFESAGVEYVAPCADDEPVYAVIASGTERAALTLAGAANVVGSVPDGDYAEGNKDAAYKAWQIFGASLKMTAEEAAVAVLDIAAKKIGEIVNALINDYELSPELVCLYGGGGSAGVVTPYLGKSLGMSWRIVKNAPIISTIGVALAMVREIVERTVSAPTEEDIRSIRQEVLEKILKAGAVEDAVEIAVEIDQKANILRAVAMGATELRNKVPGKAELTQKDRQEIAGKNLNFSAEQVRLAAAAGRWEVYEGCQEQKKLGLFKAKKITGCVIDRDGVVRLKAALGGILLTKKGELESCLNDFIDRYTEYGTVGGQLPKVYVFFGERQLDLSGLVSSEQIKSVLDIELEGMQSATEIILVAAHD